MTKHGGITADDRRWKGLVWTQGLDAGRETGEFAQACLDAGLADHLSYNIGSQLFEPALLKMWHLIPDVKSRRKG